jgi:hypothetical protein
MLVASGDRGLVAAGFALLVARPGGSWGRRYAADGSNQLAAAVPPHQLVTAAANGPLTVTPSYAYAVVDVDYDRAADPLALRAQVEDLEELAIDVGVPIARVRSGGGGGEWPNEHLWLVCGAHTLQPAGRWRLAAALRDRFGLLQPAGGLVEGTSAAQQLRPPGSQHRTGVWPTPAHPVALLDVLAAPTPAAWAWTGLLKRLEQPHATPRPPVRRPEAAPRRGLRAVREPAGWATDLLAEGPEQGVDRSVAGCRLVGHLLSRGWDVPRIVDELADSPASGYLADRLGAAGSLQERVAGDVVRIASKHHGGPRKLAPQVQAVADRWGQLQLEDGTEPRWLLQSGRAVLGALCRRALQLGSHKVSGQRDVARLAGVSAATVGRSYRRWAEHGAVRLHLDAAGDVDAVELDPAVLARLLPAVATETPEVHTPEQAVHDAWAHRPAGVGSGGPALGVRARQVWLELHHLCGAALSELDRETPQVGRRQLQRALTALEVHGLAVEVEGVWHAVVHGVGSRLDRAAERLGTAGLLAARGARYEAQQEAWATVHGQHPTAHRQRRAADVDQLQLAVTHPARGPDEAAA